MVPKTVYRRSYKKSFKLGYFTQIFVGRLGIYLNLVICMFLIFRLVHLTEDLVLAALFACVQLSRVIQIGMGRIILWQDSISSDWHCNLNTRGDYEMKFEFSKIKQIIISGERNSMFISGIINDREESLLIRFLDAFKNYEDLISQLKSKLGDKVKIGGET